MDFFILGNPRSGTTLLRLMLNTHSLIGVPPESGFLQWWFSKYKNWEESNSGNSKQILAFLNDLMSSKKIEDWNLNKDLLLEYIIAQKPKNYSQLIDCVYFTYCYKKEIIGDKNNYYIHHLDTLETVYPHAKYIHLIRDGRDVACSYKEIKKINQTLKYIPKVSDNIEEIASEWNKNINNIEQFINTKLSITIKYEDLISTPKETLSDVCNFLGVDFEERMLSYHKTDNNNEPKSTIEWKKKTLEKVDSSNKGKYSQILSNKEIEIFNQIAAKNLAKFQYPK